MSAPKASTFKPGGESGSTNDITCDRCGGLATHSYEGVEFLNFCDGCSEAFGWWLDER